MIALTYWPFYRDNSDVDKPIPVPVALKYLLQPLPWMVDAACRGKDPELFFPSHGRSSLAGKRVCRTCTVRKECNQYAEETNSLGIWAGELRTGTSPSHIQDARPTIIFIDSRRTKGAGEGQTPSTITASSPPPSDSIHHHHGSL